MNTGEPDHLNTWQMDAILFSYVLVWCLIGQSTTKDIVQKLIIWNPNFKKFGIQMVGIRNPTVFKKKSNCAHHSFWRTKNTIIMVRFATKNNFFFTWTVIFVPMDGSMTASSWAAKTFKGLFQKSRTEMNPASQIAFNRCNAKRYRKWQQFRFQTKLSNLCVSCKLQCANV